MGGRMLQHGSEIPEVKIKKKGRDRWEVSSETSFDNLDIMWKLVNNNMSDPSIRSDTGHHLEFFWSFIHRLFSEYWIPGCLAKPAHAALLLLRLPAIGRSTIMQQRQGWAVSFCFGCNRRKWEIKLGAKWRSQGRRASSLPRLSHLRSWQPPLAPRKTTLCKWIFSMCFLKRLRNMFLHIRLFCQAGVCNANYGCNFAQQQSVLPKCQRRARDRGDDPTERPIRHSLSTVTPPPIARRL